jgi:hypothetical protein
MNPFSGMDMDLIFLLLSDYREMKYLAFILFVVCSMAFVTKSKCKVGLSSTLVRNKDNTFMLTVIKGHINDTIYDVKKIGISEINKSGSSWIYVWGTFTKNKNGRDPFTKTGWVHVSDGGDCKVVIHGIYDDEAGSLHGRKNAVVYNIEEGWKKLCK